MKFWSFLFLILSFLVACTEGSQPTQTTGSSSSIEGSSSEIEFNFSSKAEDTWNKGSGTKEDPFIIQELKDLKELSQLVQQGGTYEDKFFKLTADISLKGEEWTPIGVWGDHDLGWGNKPFRGNFDGNGHTISGLTIKKSGEGYLALFGLIKGASISNLNLKGASIEGGKVLAGIVAKADSSTIENCVVEANILGEERIGALVGEATDTKVIGTNVSEGQIEAKGAVGGLVGLLSSRSILTGLNKATIKSSLQNAGGIVGTVSGAEVIDSENQGKVIGVSNVGGIAGNLTMLGLVKHSFNSGVIEATGENSFVGGIVGDLANKSSLKGVYNLGAIKSSGFYSAGIAGRVTNGSIVSVFNHGSISASDFAGGLVGKCGENTEIYVGYNKGEIAKTKNSASLLAEALSTTKSSSLYYDSDVASVTHSELGGKTSVELKSNDMVTLLNDVPENVMTWTLSEALGGYPGFN